MNRRQLLLDLVNSPTPPSFVPAGFFLHFDPVFHSGQAAIDKQLEFFNFTGMDFIKVQFEQRLPPAGPFHRPRDWANVPRYTADFFEPTVRVVEGLVKAAAGQTLVVLTVYSPYMLVRMLGTDDEFNLHLQENPDAARVGLEIMTENVIQFVRACKDVGVDGFYISTQGGEASRFPNSDLFAKYIKPTDLAVWSEARSCPFNILHICDYELPYDDYSPFLDYPGHVVNSGLHVGDKTLTPRELSAYFGRPFMGGMERKKTIATGTPDQIRQEVNRVLQNIPDRFILGADCTVPAETPWENLRLAIATAHQHKQ